ncbi:MAG: hypothetical protein Q7K03_05005 [Dehalococcoidia bacterium]|nr:hypothetical protein [Dehalococcoidia bacterium]
MTTTKLRSPNYPAVGLGEAVSLVKKLYQAEKGGMFPPESSAGAWGYKSFSGPVRSKFAALKQYGFIDQKKGQGAKLSGRALTIALRNEASKEYLAALKEAAFEPSLFREFYEGNKFDSSDDTLKHELIVNRRFTDDGAEQFIEAFRSAMTIAQLTKPAIISGQEESQTQDKDDDMLEPPPTKDTITIPIPFSPERIGRLVIPTGMTADDWKRLDRILAAYKPES